MEFLHKFRRKNGEEPSNSALFDHISMKTPKLSPLDERNNEGSSSYIIGTMKDQRELSISSKNSSEMDIPSIAVRQNIYYSEKKSNEVRNSIISGSLAGMLAISIFHPFDVIRTKMQSATRIASKEVTKPISPKVGISSSSGPLAVFSHTIQNGGFRAFYTGFSFPLAAQACYKATVFTVNRVTQNSIVSYKSKQQQELGNFQPVKLTLQDHFLCGAIAGSTNALVFVSPVEYVRSQLIAQHTHIAEGTTHLLKYGIMKGPIDVVKATYKDKGVFGLWKGAGITLVRDFFGMGTFFVCFELGKRTVPSITGDPEPSSKINTIGAGMMAGFGCWCIALPMDALKTLVQTGKAKSARNVVLKLLERDGVVSTAKQLCTGWQLAFGRGTPAAAVSRD